MPFKVCRHYYVKHFKLSMLWKLKKQKKGTQKNVLNLRLNKKKCPTNICIGYYLNKK